MPPHHVPFVFSVLGGGGGAPSCSICVQCIGGGGGYPIMFHLCSVYRGVGVPRHVPFVFSVLGGWVPHHVPFMFSMGGWGRSGLTAGHSIR